MFHLYATMFLCLCGPWFEVGSLVVRTSLLRKAHDPRLDYRSTGLASWHFRSNLVR